MFNNCNNEALWPFLLWALGAFILGYLLRLFLSRRKYEGRISSLEDENADLRAQLQAGGSGMVAGGGVASANDLTKIEGVGRRVEGLLNDAGISTYAGLADTSIDSLRKILDDAGGKFRNIDPTSWPRQAKLAASGKWGELDTLQDELIAGTYVGTKAGAISGGDDLKRIEGISYRVEGLLNNAGINSYKDLEKADVNDIRKILDNAGDRYRHLNPESWPRQAALAANGKFGELENLQDELMGGIYVGGSGLGVSAGAGAGAGDDLKRIEGIGPKIESLLNQDGIRTFNELANTDVSKLKSILARGGKRYELADPGTWPEQAALAASGKWEELDLLQDELIGGVRVEGSALGTGTIQKDDLTKIEGVGPKIQELLNADGIYTFEQLAATDTARLQGILDKAGERFRVHDPGTWAEQAGLAAAGDWDKLDVLQEELKGGIRKGAGATPLGSGTAKDDLKVVEGIGPKIESLLNADGIMTWLQLSNAELSRVQKILDEAGPRYRIHDPSTWGQQALLAHEGKWDELEKLQDELKGGRKV